MYPSAAIPQRLYKVIKSHKPVKNYSMGTMVSTIGTTPYRTSKCLVEIMQPVLNKNKHCVVNSSSSVNDAATWETTQEEIQVSYDAVNFFPSTPIDKAMTLQIMT